jgi:hypothetical protein
MLIMAPKYIVCVVRTCSLETAWCFEEIYYLHLQCRSIRQVIRASWCLVSIAIRLWKRRRFLPNKEGTFYSVLLYSSQTRRITVCVSTQCDGEYCTAVKHNLKACIRCRSEFLPVPSVAGSLLFYIATCRSVYTRVRWEYERYKWDSLISGVFPFVKRGIVEDLRDLSKPNIFIFLTPLFYEQVACYVH